MILIAPVKATAQHLNIIKPFKKNVLEWSKLIILTGSAQLIIQALGFICGILIIRMLSTQEYALYTLANTMLGTMIVLADGDVARGTMALGGRVWNDKEQLGTVIATGLDLRKKFAVISLVLATPALLLLLREHGASWVEVVLIVLSLIPAFWTALSGTMLEIAPKLQQDIAPLQKIQIWASLGRLVVLVSTMFFFPVAFVAILAAGFSQVWANVRLRKLTIDYADWGKEVDYGIRKEILAMVKRLLPGAIYYCLSGQITIWLISIFGSTAAIAEIGALGRLAMVLNIFNMIFLTLVVPRFARMPDRASLLLRRFVQIQLGALALGTCLVFFIWMFAEQVLWVLGHQYAGLKAEVVLSITGSCISLIAGACFTLCISRGWAINPLVSISISIASIICGLVFIEVSTLQGVLVFNIFIASIQLCMYFIYSLSNFLRMNDSAGSGVSTS